MNNQVNKIVLVGCGFVGSTFLYTAIIQGLAKNYVLIDVNKDVAFGNQLDLEDVHASLDTQFDNVTAGDYTDCHDADVIVITAGRNQKPGETRIDLIKDNVIIIKDCISKIKNSGFKGIIVIASNPVDIITNIAQKESGYPPNRIFGSGTNLETARLKHTLKTEFKTKISDIETYVVAEHGDSAVPVLSQTKINGKPLMSLIKSEQELHKVKTMSDEITKKAYQIINTKRATYYGIGASLAKIVSAIINDKKIVIPVSACIENMYHQKEKLYIGTPAIIGKNGIEKIIELPLNQEEQLRFNNSCKLLLNTINAL